MRPELLPICNARLLTALGKMERKPPQSFPSSVRPPLACLFLGVVACQDPSIVYQYRIQSSKKSSR